MPSTFYADLLQIASREVDPKRLDTDRLALLDLATQVVGRAETAALLWLYDNDPHGEEELRLSYAFDAAEFNRRPPALRGIAFPASRDSAPHRIINWFRANHPDVELQELWKDIHSGTDRIGRLQILFPVGRDADDSRLALIVQVLADTIAAERRERPALAVRRFQGKVASTWDRNDILQAIADTAQEFTTAHSGIVYHPFGAETGRELAVAAVAGVLKTSATTLRALMAPRNSLTYTIFRQGHLVRIADISDDDEVLRICGRKPDAAMLARLLRLVGRVRAWMTGTVRVRSFGGTQGILLIKLVNKAGTYYLHNAFTSTDARILKALIDHLGDFLPWTEGVLAQREVSGAIGSLPSCDQGDPLIVTDTLHRSPVGAQDGKDENLPR